MLDGIPPSQDSDAEDVVWALQTADALWKRNERVDAIVWLRRAAQAAGEAQDDDRALNLARGAAELTELLSAGPIAAAPNSVPPGFNAGIDELLELPRSVPPPAVTQSNAPTAFPPAEPAVADQIPVSAQDSDEAMSNEEMLRVEVPTAAQAHAGMLDPWANDRGSEPPPSGRSGRPTGPPTFDEDEVVTSAFSPAKKPSHVPRSSDAPTNPPLVAERPDSLGPSLHTRPTPPIGHEDAAPVSSFEVMSARSGAEALRNVATPPPLPPRPAKISHAPPLPFRAPSSSVPPSVPQPLPVPARLPLPAPPPRPEARIVELPLPPPQIVVEEVPLSAVPSLQMQPVPEVDLGGIPALAELAIATRDAFALAATISDLAKDEEASGFALAFVLEGEVDVAATIVDAPVARYPAGSILRSRGSIDDEVSIRLICASDRASVALWKEPALAEAFRDYPAVDASLRAAANEMLALAGVSLGALGERLDKALREHVTCRLQVRGLVAGEVVVAQGQPMPGLVVIGVGELELVKDDQVQGTLGPGDFLFASEVISSGKAPSTARAAKGGALLMSAGRAVAQELLVTCPPLLELFAGM